MSLLHRTLAPAPLPTLQSYLDQGGGKGLNAATQTDGDALITMIEESGLQARGGAGKLCGSKWRIARSYGGGALVPPSFVVNAAEGEPGSFKDRAILFRNPYQVLEGALIGARAIGANEVIIGLKRSHQKVRERLDRAIDELGGQGWLDDITVKVFAGPNEYLYGEETAMLEAMDGRAPFPRIAPPFRHGVHEIVDRVEGAAPVGPSATQVTLASPGPTEGGSPTVVNNVETLANVPAIIVHGPAWFRSVGTAGSPGSVVCTVTGATRRHGVGEVPMGTPLREVIELVGGGPIAGRTIKAVIGGAATPLLTGDQLDTPVSNEGMADIGARLGCGAFIVFDDASDMAAVAEGVAQFLSIESCGLCVPCKEDGMSLAKLFGRVRRSEATDHDRRAIDDHLRTVEDGARCGLASQYPLVLQSILDKFAEEIDGHIDGTVPPADEILAASVVDIDGDRARLDVSHRNKMPDWSFEPRWSGKFPADIHNEPVHR
jgi:NADH:ubiquinone oxidoreductase subunit F (NADH-binding)